MSKNPAAVPRLQHFTDSFEKVICISLRRSEDRRQYLRAMFGAAGVENWEFLDATDKDEPVVSEYYRTGRVMTFPPCFRCGKESCGNKWCNNVLIAPQVSTFISYLRLWEKLKDEGDRLFLIVEDDVVFTPYAERTTEAVVRDPQFEKFRQSAEPVLLRFGWQRGKEHRERFRWTRWPFEREAYVEWKRGALRMANECHAINGHMARWLLEQFTRIDTTSDLYQHRLAEKAGYAWTLFPPIASQLSWRTGRFESLIHPQSDRVKFLKRHHPDRQDEIAAADRAAREHFAHVNVRPILVVGHPRCGSAYMTNFLRAYGLDVAHEAMGEDGISSWMFATDAEEVPYARNKYARSRRWTLFHNRIHYTRDPKTAMPSIIRENEHSPRSYEFRREHIREAFGVDLDDATSPLERAVLSYVYWNLLVERMGVDFQVRVEDQQQELLDFLRSRGVRPRRMFWRRIPGNDVHSHKTYGGKTFEKPSLNGSDWAAVPAATLDLLADQCRRYGYALPFGAKTSVEEKHVVTR